LMGSASDSVVRHAHCPVMVVRWKPVVFPAKILLATDASEEAHLAAATAADLVERTGSELHVVHVGVELTHGAYPGVQVGPLPGVHQDELDRQAKGLFEAEVDRIRSSGNEVAGEHLRRGRADREIVLLAEEEGADLIIMGSRGLGRIRRALMGSVSDSVVRHAHCPVLVVRQEKGRA
jgi:nucleotide-binding universal stress UspA family protein